LLFYSSATRIFRRRHGLLMLWNPRRFESLVKGILQAGVVGARIGWSIVHAMPPVFQVGFCSHLCQFFVAEADFAATSFGRRWSICHSGCHRHFLAVVCLQSSFVFRVNGVFFNKHKELSVAFPIVQGQQARQASALLLRHEELRHGPTVWHDTGAASKLKSCLLEAGHRGMLFSASMRVYQASAVTVDCWRTEGSADSLSYSEASRCQAGAARSRFTEIRSDVYAYTMFQGFYKASRRRESWC
jgi:hypothetical protein